MKSPAPTKIILALLLSLQVLNVSSTYGQAFKSFATNSLFSDLNNDSLYVSATSFKSSPTDNSLEPMHWLGPIIPRRTMQAMNLSFPICFALGKLSIDKEENYTAYLLATRQSKVYLFVYSANKRDFVFKEELASYVFLESAYEKIRNSWIADLNQDGTLEIATWEKLIDFEFPNDYAENSSYEDRFIYYLINDEFKYTIWSSELLKKVSLKP